ncbi:YjfB family protein [Thalassobacillus hwangdonensis]|uniref:YjfB family protein n=1 Tax=Thalassobacillus hwangdonensis TaxID=546108 RepID=A0ABW3L4J9_9BACI
MDIAALSVVMNQGKLKQDAGIALMDKTMNQMESNGNQLVEMLEKSSVTPAHPTLGARIDISG